MCVPTNQLGFLRAGSGDRLRRKYGVAGIAAVVATTAGVIVGPGLPELVSLVARHVGPGCDDADLAQFGGDQLGRAGRCGQLRDCGWMCSVASGSTRPVWRRLLDRCTRWRSRAQSGRHSPARSRHRSVDDRCDTGYSKGRAISPGFVAVTVEGTYYLEHGRRLPPPSTRSPVNQRRSAASVKTPRNMAPPVLQLDEARQLAEGSYPTALSCSTPAAIKVTSSSGYHGAVPQRDN